MLSKSRLMSSLWKSLLPLSGHRMSPSSLDLQTDSILKPWCLRASTDSTTMGCSFLFLLPFITMEAMAWESV